MLVVESGSQYLAESFIDKQNVQPIAFIKKQVVNREQAINLLKGKDDKEIENILRLSRIGADAYSIVLHDGTTNEDLLDILIHRIEILQKEAFCEQNKQALVKLKEAKHWCLDRIQSKKNK